MRTIAMIAVGVVALVSVTAFAQQKQFATMRSATPLAENAAPRPMPKPENSDLRQVRNYPEQPPLIPHTIDGYQVDKNSNKCLTCHSRTAVEVSQAPMVSITHFMNRDNQFLASVTPRRYFCNQCHVPQTDARPLVENTFVDVDKVIDYVKSKEGAK